MSDTHGEFITGEINGQPFSAFIDGVPDKCQHEWNGSGYDIISSIDYVSTEYVAAPPDETPEEYYRRDQELRKNGKYISDGCVSCSKCGKAFEPNLWEI